MLLDKLQKAFARAFNAPAPADRQLFSAIQKGDTGRVREILQEHPETMTAVYSPVCPEGPLSFAAHSGRVAICQLLIDHGAAVEQRGAYAQTALAQAVDGWIRGDAILDPDPRSQFDPADHAATILLLLKHGADINTVNSIGHTPLDRCQHGFAETAGFLINHGADMERRDPHGNTILMSAARNESDKIVALLLAKGARTDAVNDAGMTALDIAKASTSFADRPQHGKTIALLEQAALRNPPRQFPPLRPGF